MAYKMAKNLTLRDKFALYLTNQGFYKVETKSGKYVCYRKPNTDLHLFLGTCGAVRKGSSPAAAKSLSITHDKKFRDMVVGWCEDKKLDKNHNLVID